MSDRHEAAQKMNHEIGRRHLTGREESGIPCEQANRDSTNQVAVATHNDEIGTGVGGLRKEHIGDIQVGRRYV